MRTHLEETPVVVVQRLACKSSITRAESSPLPQRQSQGEVFPRSWYVSFIEHNIYGGRIVVSGMHK
jgi:hypothetical protein